MRYLILISLIGIIQLNVFAQQPLQLKLKQRGEVVVSIDANDLSKLPNQGTWSIDKIKNGKAVIYLNTAYYNKLVDLEIPFVPELIPSLVSEVKMAHSSAEMQEWNAYPDYDTYISMMQQFAIDFPEICKLDTVGYSVQGRLLLAVKISDNVNIDEPEPEFFYTSSMHGDELTGYVLMLRLIDYLLNNYENSEIKKLVDGIEIYINPLANPDGTFAAGNSSVNGAKRYNANNFDLNRNYPAPLKSDHPDGNDWQPETQAMMDFMQIHNFGISMNFHGGAEVLNYPWDEVVYTSNFHADYRWFHFICSNYVAKAREVDAFYMTDINEDGVTLGSNWYVIDGGRQDYVTYFLKGREVTGELSGIKLVDASELPSFWDKNHVGLLGYMEQALYGLQGTVTNENNEPIHAKIEVLDHDKDSSHVWTQNSGVYYRYLKEGVYDIKVSASGYLSKTLAGIEIIDLEATLLDVQLGKGVSVASLERVNVKVYPNPSSGIFTMIGLQGGNSSIKIHSLDGKMVYESTFEKNISSKKIDVNHLSKGVYLLSIESKNIINSQKLIIE